MTLTIKIDYDKCNECGECVEACIYGVFELLDNIPIVSHPENCIFNCGKCENKCAANAIAVEGANPPVDTQYIKEYNDMKKQLLGTKNED